MDIIELARQLGKAIQEDPDYIKLVAAREANDADTALQELIAKFNLLATSYDYEGQKEDADESKLESLGADMEKLYAEIMSNKKMAEFTELKDIIDDKMNDIVAILAAAVNGEDPMTYDPAAEHHHCDGDCDCCSGC